MDKMSAGPNGANLLTWAVAGAPMQGFTESGDVHVVAPFDHGVLVAVIDGLGHGPEAALAAKEAARLLELHAGESVLGLVQRCHEGLRKTRGVVMSIASFDERDDTMTWVGVGNVEGLLLRATDIPNVDQAIAARGGVIGYQIPALRPVTLPVAQGDILVMATDGIHGGFADRVDRKESPEAIASAIFSRNTRGSDDSLVLVARYRGNRS